MCIGADDGSSNFYPQIYPDFRYDNDQRHDEFEVQDRSIPLQKVISGLCLRRVFTPNITRTVKSLRVHIHEYSEMPLLGALASLVGTNLQALVCLFVNYQRSLNSFPN
jgi:hypothetical protein